MKRVACFRMPKVASISLAFALGERCEMINHVVEKEHGETLRRFRQGNPGVFVFSFVRNPFDRLVSAYSWITQRPDSNRASEEWKKHVVPYGGNFGDFVAGEIGEGRGMELLHLRTQASWIVDRDGSLMVDWLGKYETLHEDLGRLCARMGWSGVRLEKNNGSRRKDYGGYYTPETAKMVASVYAKDFEIGGYPSTV